MKNVNSNPVGENVTIPSSNHKILALCQTDESSCQQVNKVTEIDNSTIEAKDSPTTIHSSEDASDSDSDRDFDIGEDLKNWLYELCAR